MSEFVDKWNDEKLSLNSKKVKADLQNLLAALSTAQFGAPKDLNHVQGFYNIKKLKEVHISKMLRQVCTPSYSSFLVLVPPLDSESFFISLASLFLNPINFLLNSILWLVTTCDSPHFRWLDPVNRCSRVNVGGAPPTTIAATYSNCRKQATVTATALIQIFRREVKCMLTWLVPYIRSQMTH